MYGNIVTLCGMTSFVMLSEAAFSKRRRRHGFTRSWNEGISRSIMKPERCCIRKEKYKLVCTYSRAVAPSCLKVGLALLLWRLNLKLSKRLGLYFQKEPTVHPWWFLISFPVSGGWGGGVLWRVRFYLPPVVAVARAEAEWLRRASRTARLLGSFTGCQACLVQALRAILELQAPQTGLILPLRSQWARLSGVNCEEIYGQAENIVEKKYLSPITVY